MEIQGIEGYFKKIYRLVSLLLFLLLLAISGIDSLFAEETGELAVKVVPEFPSLGDEFKLELMVKGSFFSSVVVTPPPDSRYFKVTGGPFIRPNIEQNGVTITFNILARRRGKHRLGSFRVIMNTLRLETKPIYIEVIDTKPKLYWQIGKKTVKLGEPVPLTLMLENWDELRMPLSITVRPPRNSWFEEAVSNEELTVDQVKGKRLYRIPLRTYLVTFSKKGKYRISPARVEVKKGVKIYTPPAYVTVLPLPKEILPYSAIGSFNIRFSYSSTKLSQGKGIEVTVRISGRGNLNFLSLPIPRIEGLKVNVGEKKRSIIASSKGYNGYVEETFQFFPEKPGKYRCVIPDFPYLDDSSNRIKVLKGRVIYFSVGEKEAKVNRVVPFSFRSLSDFTVSRKRDDYFSFQLILLLIPGPLIFLVYMIYMFARKRKGRGVISVSIFLVLTFVASGTTGLNSLQTPGQNPDSLFASGVNKLEKEDYESALTYFEKLEDLFPSNRDVLFNLSYSYYMLDRPVKAMHMLRKLLKTNGSDRIALEFLKRIEEELGIDEDIPPSLSMPVNILLPGGIILFNLIFIFLILYLAGGRIIFLTLVFISGLALIGDGAVLGYYSWYRSRKTGIVVKDSTDVRKIPEEESKPWLRLKRGMPLLDLGVAGEFILVRTADGAVGWVTKDAIELDLKE